MTLDTLARIVALVLGLACIALFFRSIIVAVFLGGGVRGARGGRGAARTDREAAWRAFYSTQDSYANLLVGLAERIRTGPATWQLTARGEPPK